jgi:predicted HD superfamily hydrolase involved in NAD metabolism
MSLGFFAPITGKSSRKKVQDRGKLLKKLKKELGRDRYKHTLGTEKVALELAEIHGVSRSEASLAALLHDYARKYPPKELPLAARKLKIRIDPIQKEEPKLLHGEIGVILAKTEFGVSSPAVLNAIRNHTTGRPGMGKMEKIIFLADHVEDGRAFSGIQQIRKLAKKDLDAAVLEAASQSLIYLIESRRPIHKMTIETRNYYLNKVKQ